MGLTREIAALPLGLALLLLVVVPTFLTMCGPVIVRRLVGVELVKENNEVAGFKFATLGVVYAVLLGLAVIAVWEKFAKAEDATSQEAGALACSLSSGGRLRCRFAKGPPGGDVGLCPVRDRSRLAGNGGGPGEHTSQASPDGPLQCHARASRG